MNPQESLVLVGFGDNKLYDLLDKGVTQGDKDTFNALMEAPFPNSKLGPPHYRPARICSQDEIDAFLAYVDLMGQLIKAAQEDLDEKEI